MNFLSFFFIVFFSVSQVIFSFVLFKVKPKLEIVPNVISESHVNALSFGDRQFYFRMLGLKMQNFGDSFGRFTALKDYDYIKLKNWFFLLDKIDNKSDFIPTLAGYYFSQTQNEIDVIHVVEYLRKHAMIDIGKKWWWLVHAAFLADTRLKNKDLAIDISYDIKNLPKNAPVWAKCFSSIMLLNAGEKEKAEAMFYIILKNYQDISNEEWNFIEYFFKDRLGKFYKKDL